MYPRYGVRFTLRLQTQVRNVNYAFVASTPLERHATCLSSTEGGTRMSPMIVMSKEACCPNCSSDKVGISLLPTMLVYYRCVVCDHRWTLDPQLSPAAVAS